MEHYICQTCGTQYAASLKPPESCRVCTDDRQYVNSNGQQWTTLAEMKTSGHRIVVQPVEPGLKGLGVEPAFAIGQRSLLVQAHMGNILWDPVSYIDETAVHRIKDMGGVQAISVSHPHFYASMVEWSHAFDRAPIYLPAADYGWVMRNDPVIHFYEDSLMVMPGITLIRCGGHFDGSAVLHWANGADGRGALLAGDTLMVTQDRRHVSFMYSFPNLIPLSASAVLRIVERVNSYRFERIYSAWWDRTISVDATAAVHRSADRYLKAIQEHPHLHSSGAPSLAPDACCHQNGPATDPRSFQ
jgi:hypothetical protein